jgi:hypothetical protein
VTARRWIVLYALVVACLTLLGLGVAALRDHSLVGVAVGLLLVVLAALLAIRARPLVREAHDWLRSRS